MADENGHRDERLDRIEKAVDQLIADHEKFRMDHRQLLIAQVLQKEEIEKLLAVSKEQTLQIGELRAKDSGARRPCRQPGFGYREAD